MNVVMIGAGYVGLTTGACFASLGHHVCCTDVSVGRIRDLKKGVVPIYEPGLDSLVRKGRQRGRLRYSCEVAVEVAQADFVFIAVGTPALADGDIDLSYVESAALGIASFIKDAILVIKSTVAVGTAEALVKLMAEASSGHHVRVASNPEFLREGSAIADFMYADRIVVGSDEWSTRVSMRKLYRPLTDRGVPLVETSTTNAELIKYAANAFLALKIGFINDVACMCENAGGDIVDVAGGMELDKRIGKAFLQPGPGFGGSCFPKDTRAFAASGRRLRAPQPLIETLIDRNETRKIELADRIVSVVGASHGGKVAVLGMTFKAQTDDVRESAALTIVPVLLKAGLVVSGHDPKGRFQAQRLLGDEVLWHDDVYAAVSGADAVVILTEWEDYRHLDLGRIARSMRGDHLFDYRNLFSVSSVVRHGLTHHCLGRATIEPEQPSVYSEGDRKAATG